MDKLQEKYSDYQKLIGCTLSYILENGSVIDVCFNKENFPHLLGLHKLKDIRVIQDWQDARNYSVKNKDVIRKIKSGKLNYQIIKSSHFYNDIKDRFDAFSYDDLMKLVYTDVIISFDPSKVPSKLRCDFLLFKKDLNGEYNHMGIGVNSDTNERYLETYFHEASDKYIKNQLTVKIVRVRLIDSFGSAILDSQL